MSSINERQTRRDYQSDMHLLVLLHGIGKSSHNLNILENFMKKEGFAVLNIGYPSTKYPIEELANIISHQINQLAGQYKTVSFIGFSLGGLIIRAFLNKYKLPNLGKVVLVGTPNKGSKVADYLKNNKLYQKWYGPVGQQLITNYPYPEDLLGKLYYECGIIAGNLPIDLWYPIMRREANDGKVTVSSTKIDGMKDHIVLNVTHWFMPRSKKIRYQILHFLKYSEFKK